MGAYVSLLEYNNIEGMILLSELSRRRIRSIGKLLKVGRQEPVMVLRVDKEKGYIEGKKAASKEALEAEIKRLDGMGGKSMAADKKAWVSKRAVLLRKLKDEV